MSNSVALVTGGAQGLGQAIALRLAQDGFDVAVDDVPGKSAELEATSKEIEGLGRKSIFLTADVTREANVKEMVEKTVATLGRLDVMVANAGIAPKAATNVAEVDISAWEALWAVNIRGVVLCYKYAAQQMIKQGTGGRIIGDLLFLVCLFIATYQSKGASSLCGLKGFAGFADYCISKAAVRSLTQTTALELKDHNITVNAYAPGVINTPMSTSHGAYEALRLADSRTGEADDVAGLVSYLASPGARHVTGQTIAIDGGALL
ncbi:3-oxoacyl-[acyl-carrier-protein] reductase FabG [Leucoagaricus sp. SymC.cos]|nr:3-oxoacyl-[acyl-carrier-protein] reductase FabG [Leucoagaricus sp. SymC.cos]